MSIDFISRIIGMVVFSIGGLRVGAVMANLADDPPGLWVFVLTLFGALFGLVLTPYLTVRPVRSLRDYLARIPSQQLFAGVVGMVVGLIVAALAALPLSLLPNPWNSLLPLASAVVMAYIGATIFSMRRKDVFEALSGRYRAGSGQAQSNGTNQQILLDTSVIIDGRISDISQTGFIMATMLVPRFVLNELQHIADSSDPLRRQRGRRGMDILNELQKDATVPVQITDMDVEGIEAVDEKLVVIAKQIGCSILTNDFNLNRVAELQGVTVLNINDLANAVKTVFLPGEALEIQIIQEGREIGQGVGYLEDGTMVVVTDGKDHLNKVITTTVTKVLQTSAGRMIFAEPS